MFEDMIQKEDEKMFEEQKDADAEKMFEEQKEQARAEARRKFEDQKEREAGAMEVEKMVGRKRRRRRWSIFRSRNRFSRAKSSIFFFGFSDERFLLGNGTTLSSSKCALIAGVYFGLPPTLPATAPHTPTCTPRNHRRFAKL